MIQQQASKEKHRWVLGTSSFNTDNEVNVIEYDEETGNLECVGQYNHAEQIWCMDTSPKDSSLLVTSFQDKNMSNGISLFKMPGQTLAEIEGGDSNEDVVEKRDLQFLQSIEKTGAEKRDPACTTSVKWSHHSNDILTTKASTVSVYSISESSVGEPVSLDLRLDTSYEASKVSNSTTAEAYSVATWDLHSPGNAAVAYGSYLYTMDTRSMTVTNKVYAHSGLVRDVDCNPNKPNMVVTSGDDRKVRFWDVRSMKEPVRTLLGHGHWAWTAKYNPFHDQLVLSGGADNRVNLWRVASCSSSPWLGGGLDDDNSDSKEENDEKRSLMSERSGKEGAGSSSSSSVSGDSSESAASEDSQSMDPPDVLIKGWDQHTDTVYSVAWSPADAWVYCSMSFDGKVYLNHVPAAEKYKLLL